MMRAWTSSLPTFPGADDRFHRTGHVALDDEREFLPAVDRTWLIICSSEPRMVAERAAAFSRLWRWR